MKKEFQTGTSYVPSFRTGSTDVNTIQHRYFQELKKDCSVNSASDAYYLSAIAWFCLTFSSLRLLSVRLFVCIGQRNYRRKEAENDILFYRA